MKLQKYQIRNMTRQDLNIIMDWADAEGWNPGVQDAEPFYASDPAGFFMGFLNEKPISCISAVAYDKHFGFLGFYIVHPKFRGHGYGVQIWNKAMEYLGSRTIGLDGVIAQQKNYKKSGFHLAYRTMRHQGTSKKVKDIFPEIVPASSIPFVDLLNYDRSFFPAPRPAFLKLWVQLRNSFSLIYRDQQKVVGFGTIRKCRKGYKIGPLFADKSDIAEKLICTLTGKIPAGSAFFLDVPEVNPSAVDLVQHLKMEKVFETARMYTGKAPHLPLKQIYGVTTLELG